MEKKPHPGFHLQGTHLFIKHIPGLEIQGCRWEEQAARFPFLRGVNRIKGTERQDSAVEMLALGHGARDASSSPAMPLTGPDSRLPLLTLDADVAGWRWETEESADEGA